MLFRKIIFIAFFSALIAGLFLGSLQFLATSKIIYAAEQYEVEEAVATLVANDGHAHQHSNTVWEPKAGTERIAYTFLADVLIAFGHGLLLVSFMVFMLLKFSKPALSWRSGFVVGFGGYLSFYLATVIGLPPEVPGTVAADLEARQLWWALTVIATLVGLTLLYLAPMKFKLLGILALLLPHLIGAPQPELHGYLTTEPNAIVALSQLEHQLLLSTAWVNLAYWLVLGTVSGFLAQKILQQRKTVFLGNSTYN
ncbi:MAG: CbtA family protein [Cocleimonas sp.]|nr:CbtA family protein [Cocleimonas sp.]